MQRQNNFEGTSRSQLVLNKRLGAKGGGGGEAPQGTASLDSARGMAYQRFISQQQASDADRDVGMEENNFSLVGYRAPPKLASASLLSNLGSSVLRRLPEDIQVKKATPYVPSKDLLVENFNPAPGYTGSRSRRSNL
jgi:hypothetical protein